MSRSVKLLDVAADYAMQKDCKAVLLAAASAIAERHGTSREHAFACLASHATMGVGRLGPKSAPDFLAFMRGLAIGRAAEPTPEQEEEWQRLGQAWAKEAGPRMRGM